MVLAAAVLAFIAPLVSAAPINGEFSGGLSGWLGEVTDTSLSTQSDITPLPGVYTGNFAVDSGAAVLTTSTAVD